MSAPGCGDVPMTRVKNQTKNADRGISEEAIFQTVPSVVLISSPKTVR